MDKLHVELDELDKLYKEFDELDKLHAELDELHKLNYKFVKFDKLNSKLDELDKLYTVCKESKSSNFDSWIPIISYELIRFVNSGKRNLLFSPHVLMLRKHNLSVTIILLRSLINKVLFTLLYA